MQLLPHDDKFFDLLVAQARIAAEASQVLTDGFSAGTESRASQATARNIRALERKGDEALRELNRKLHSTFITPIDPEDIHQLTSEIDEILDHVEAIAYRLDAYGFQQPPSQLGEISKLLNRCVQSTVEALIALQHDGVKKPEVLAARCREINDRELDIENRVREAVRDLFANQKDPIELIKQKELYELLESAGDCCESVADILEMVGVKNS